MSQGQRPISLEGKFKKIDCCKWACLREKCIFCTQI